ncbi:MAG: exopolyphosphatase [Betaproteobacteria bacterium RIFCSPLOWO2_02_FULL_65_20]|nr:MAG: exopolyphosphatase [Betaproteobacteria bacterium RIFCSPLOWO2_02_FULL_65_20]
MLCSGANGAVRISVKHETLAAVDLGSNSFHLQIGRVVGEQVYLLDSLRDSVRLGAGLTRERRLDRSTQLRALEALGRFGERLRGFPRGAVRAVGTNALRVARNADEFLAEAKTVLGFPIEVIFGREEARLIYLGVAHTLPPSPDRRLVVDIGGGSTEFIIGTGLKPELVESITMGCVSYSLKYFPEGRIDKSGFKRAELAAANELQPIVKSFRRTGWKDVIASSGTARSLAGMVREGGWAEQGITAAGLKKLRSAFIEAGDVEQLKLPGLRDDRAPILPGGLAIMSAILAEFGIDALDVSEGALRQGVLYDLLGRVQHHDMREVTVAEFMRRYHVDMAQAERVAGLATRLQAELVIEPPEAELLMLRWACLLHEIGIPIAHAAYHKHSAYILSQADMPGYSRDEQARLARLVLAHRGKLAKLEALPARSSDWSLIFALRLAVLFYQARSDIALPRIACRATDSGFALGVERRWLDEHPLTEAALEAEADEWHSQGMRLEIRALAEEKTRAS